MSDALPEPVYPALTQDEYGTQVCDWADYRENYSTGGAFLPHEHKAFLAGWKAHRDTHDKPAPRTEENR